MKTLLAILSILILNISYAAQKPQVISLIVTEKGFEPNSITVKPGTEVELKITRKTNSTCAREVLIPTKNIKKELPLDKEVTIKVWKVEKGEINFGCGMNMVTGIIHVN